MVLACPGWVEVGEEWWVYYGFLQSYQVRWIFPGGQLRANVLSQGQSNGFPTYRLKWQKVGSIHRRFRGCNKMVRAKPYAYGADEYVNLELYLAWRGRGLPVETPAVRN